MTVVLGESENSLLRYGGTKNISFSEGGPGKKKFAKITHKSIACVVAVVEVISAHWHIREIKSRMTNLLRKKRKFAKITHAPPPP